jgi:hypothetical protein
MTTTMTMTAMMMMPTMIAIKMIAQSGNDELETI